MPNIRPNSPGAGAGDGAEAALADLARIDVPTLAVVGLDSPTPSLRVTELVARAMPRSTLRMIPDAGHMSNLEQPVAFALALWSFLR